MKVNRVSVFIWLVLTLAAGAAAPGGRGITVVPVSALAPGGNAGLFVGINEFRVDTAVRPLNFAVNDAIAQAHLFVVELKLLPGTNTHLALSGEPGGEKAKAQLEALIKDGVQRVDAAKAHIMRSLLSITGVAGQPSDLLVVSISSHGFEERGVAYILPSDGLRGALEDTGLNLSSVELKLAQSKAGKRLLLIDACREQPVTGTKGLGDSMSAGFRSALASAEGQAVLASCDAGQLSLEDPKLGHGLFTFFLLKALRGEAGADTRGFITLGTVSDYVAKSVHDWVGRNKPTTDQRFAQQPWFKGPKIAEQIPLAVDSGIREQQNAFKAEAVKTIETLKGKINRKGEFNAALYERLAVRLEQAQDDEAGRKLLAKAKDFSSGKIDEDLFVPFLVSALGSAEPQPIPTPTKPEVVTKPEPATKPEPKFGNPGQATKDQPWTNSLGMKFVPVKGTDVLFCIWKTRVEDFDAFVQATRHKMDNDMFSLRQDGFQQRGDTWKSPGFMQDPMHPVCGVNWSDAKAFCAWMTKKEQGEGRLQLGQTYRLPTDAEWSVAIGLGEEWGNTPEEKTMGNKDVCPWGRQWPPPRGAGNYGGEESRVGAPVTALWIIGYSDDYPRTSPVGSFKPNQFGLYDLSGNLWEWCEDLYKVEALWRTARGGSWFLGDTRTLLSSSRSYVLPGLRNDIIGFRCVLVVGASP